MFLGDCFHTSHYGIPQHRERVYIVGIRKDAATKWRWPKQLADTRPLIDLLDPLRECPRAAEKRFLQTCSALNRRSLQQAIAQIEAQRIDCFNETVGIIIDIDG